MAADSNSLKSMTKSTLRDIAKHANNLANGLQNAAPPSEGGGVNKSVQYLLDTAAQLNELIESLDEV
jgi:hypothetical protein